MSTDSPKAEPPVLSPPPLPAPQSSDTNPASTEPAPRKKKRWLPLVIILAVLLVVMPVLGIIAAIAIPAIKGAAEVKKSLQEQPIPVASRAPEKAKMVESPVAPEPEKAPEAIPAAEAVSPPDTNVAETPVAVELPQADEEVEVNESTITRGPLALKTDAPVWAESTERKELQEFLAKLWQLEKLADDPFYELGEMILAQNVDRAGPLDQASKLALFILPRKLREYPHLGCGALTIMSPNDRGVVLREIESLVPGLNDPLLTLQIAALKADHSNDTFHIRDTLDALESALASGAADQLSDGVLYHLLSERFLYRIPEIAPDNYLNIVVSSNSIPQWLKDYKTGEVLWQKMRKDYLAKRFDEDDEMEVEKAHRFITEKLAASWKANPNHPAAAALMMEVIQEHQGTEIDDIRMWFDRATEARADYGPAYRTYMKVLTDSGVKKETPGIDFGRACTAANLDNAVVAMVLVNAHQSQSIKSEKPGAEYWSTLSPEEVEELDALFMNLDSMKNLVHDGVSEKFTAAIAWYLMGEKEKSAQQLKALNGRFDTEVLRSFPMQPIETAQFEEFLKQES